MTQIRKDEGFALADVSVKGSFLSLRHQPVELMSMDLRFLEKLLMKNLILALAILFSLPVLACDDVKTLPPAMYSQMKSGKKLDKVWIAPTFDKSKGVAMGEFKWSAEDRNSTIMEFLPAQLKTITKEGSPYKINVTVVRASNFKNVVVRYIRAMLGVEGTIVNSDNKVIAAFKTEVSFSEYANVDAKGGVDKVISAILKDLL